MAIENGCEKIPPMDNDLPPASNPPDAYDEDGVDLTLIQWMLSLTPAERLDVLQEAARSIQNLRGEKTGA